MVYTVKQNTNKNEVCFKNKSYVTYDECNAIPFGIKNASLIITTRFKHTDICTQHSMGYKNRFFLFSRII